MEVYILEEDPKSKTFNRIFPLIGWFMMTHFIFVAGRSIYNGTEEDIFWISHVGTLLGGIGTVFRSRSLVSIALVSIAGHHLFWLIDTTCWLTTGRFPFGTTKYLTEATWVDWFQSSNHFFSLPLLILVACRLGGIRPYAWLWSTTMFAVLSSFSFFFLPPQANINSAHRLWPGLDRTYLSVLENWPWGFYWMALVVLNGLGNYLPANLILRGIYAIALKKVETE